MGRELGDRIEKHVVDTLRAGGTEPMLESGFSSPAGETSRRYRLVPRGGLVPFAEMSTFAGGNRVTVGVTPLPAGSDKVMGYFIADPGATPTNHQYGYGHLFAWYATPQELSEAVLAEIRKLAPAGTVPF